MSPLYRSLYNRYQMVQTISLLPPPPPPPVVSLSFSFHPTNYYFNWGSAIFRSLLTENVCLNVCAASQLQIIAHFIYLFIHFLLWLVLYFTCSCISSCVCSHQSKCWPKGQAQLIVCAANKPESKAKAPNAWHLLTFVVPPAEKGSNSALLVIRGDLEN